MTRPIFLGRFPTVLMLMAGVGLGCTGGNGPVENDDSEQSDVSRQLAGELAMQSAALTAAQTAAYRALKPVLKCVDKVAGSTSYVAHFGFVNSGTGTVTIALGFNNRFWPDPQGRGQPTTFPKGTVSDVAQPVFSSNGSATWILGSNFQTATRSSKLCVTASGSGGTTGTGGGAATGGKGGAGGLGGTGGAQGGAGAGGSTPKCPSTCDDQNSCTVDSCNAMTGFLCVHVATVTGSACSDGNACTLGDRCMGGVCVGGAPRVCVASDTCHGAGTCDPASGACSNPMLPNGQTCNDGNLCTLVDACQAGQCVGGSIKTCAAADSCHLAGLCQPATGACSTPIVADGTPCDDGMMCSIGDACRTGICTAASVLSPTHCPGGATCDACTTDNCVADTDGCDQIASATDRQLCENVYACFTDPANHCLVMGDPLQCWCGSSGATCATDNAPPTQANGPCLGVVIAAAKTSDAPTIKQRLVDPDFPLGRAVNLTSCRGVFCSAECRVP